MTDTPPPPYRLCAFSNVTGYVYWVVDGRAARAGWRPSPHEFVRVKERYRERPARYVLARDLEFYDMRTGERWTV